MKKQAISLLLCFILCLSFVPAYAEIQGTLINTSKISREEEKEILGDLDPFALKSNDQYAYAFSSEIDGEPWLIYKEWSPFAKPKPVSELENPLFPSYDYIRVGDIYMARWRAEDNIGSMWRTYPTANAIEFYDKDFNLISKEDFGGYVYIYDMGYYDGKYYCTYQEDYEGMEDKETGEIRYEPIRDTLQHRNEISRWITQVSEDRVHWTETDEEIPRNNNRVNMAGNKVDLGTGSMQNINYEENQEKDYVTTFGPFFIKTDYDNFYFSTDNVYYVKVEVPDEAKQYYKSENNNMHNFYYEYNGSLFIALGSSSKFLRIPTEELYAELGQMKEAAYVEVRENILGFSTPPVMENDRMLVPMRFLFEQLGAEVEWDETTNTATATIAANADRQIQTFGTAEEKTVSFSIDNPTATVNGTAAAMDVPARLVNDKTMVPLRFLSENLGYTVTWDEATKTATVE